MLATIDTFLAQSLAGSTQTPTLIIWFGIFCAKGLLYFIPLHLLLLWFAGGKFERRAALTIVASIIIGLFISHLIGLVFYRERPFVAGIVEALIHHSPNASFPSNHATICAAYFFSLYLLRYKMAAKFALGLLVLVCWGRIFVGVHYPFDIFAGIILGGLSAYGCTRFVLPKIPAIFIAFPAQKLSEK
ncbi:undecaprenyl-diphosphatase [Bartonella sp. HY329]|uniref:undecaprenyl-diphosphatase n=1 Tax=unclassified Bartonella TaxID=2645622 RepID=UPI0021C87A0F|nr:MULTISPECIES: undecaprenyl-diphosphatase [unclassified Bartonella]UXM95147.1 undecaprenyl-diphosphatase [Bartonella sp. HY329]UXN09470.1 undecaprenyl-diphosphatase [Bartonella sp. HY328]